jgi:hypothetical protein
MSTNDDDYLIISSLDYPLLEIVIGYELSGWKGLGDFIFVVNQEKAEKIFAIQHRQVNIQFPQYLDRLVIRNFAVSSSLTFITYYQSSEDNQLPNYYQEKAIAVTSLSLDGDIFQQMIKDCLQNKVYQKVVYAHLWLVRQTISSFYAKIYKRLQHIDLGLFLAFGSINSTSSILSGFGNNPVNWLRNFIISLLIMVLSLLLINLRRRYFGENFSEFGQKIFSTELDQAIFISGIVIPNIVTENNYLKPLLMILVTVFSLLMRWIKDQKIYQRLIRIEILPNSFASLMLEIILELFLIMVIFLNLHFNSFSNTIIVAQVLLINLLIFRFRDRLPSLITQWFWRKILKG